MHFSSREKETIKKISAGAIHDLASFIREVIPLREEKNTWSNFIGSSFTVSHGAIVKMIEDEDGLARELSVFIALCMRLQELQLLQVLENSTPKQMPPMLARNPSGASFPSKISMLFTNNLGFEVVPFHELGELVENDFLTRDERNLREERNARETAQRTTVVVAVLSLLISTATSVGVTYFNYKTYTTERTVSISNLDAIKYPIPVSIAEVPSLSAIATKGSNPAVNTDLAHKAAQGRLP